MRLAGALRAPSARRWPALCLGHVAPRRPRLPGSPWEVSAPVHYECKPPRSRPEGVGRQRGSQHCIGNSMRAAWQLRSHIPARAAACAGPIRAGVLGEGKGVDECRWPRADHHRREVCLQARHDPSVAADGRPGAGTSSGLLVSAQLQVRQRCAATMSCGRWTSGSHCAARPRTRTTTQSDRRCWDARRSPRGPLRRRRRHPTAACRRWRRRQHSRAAR